MDKTRLAEVLREELETLVGCSTAGLNEDSLLKEECGLDSLSLVALIVALEERLGICFDESDLDPQQLTTWGDLLVLAVRYV